MLCSSHKFPYSTQAYIAISFRYRIEASSLRDKIARRYGLFTHNFLKPATTCSSSETQGQLVGTTGFSWAKVYNKSGRAPGHLLLPNEFQKRLKSRLLIGQKNIFQQPGDCHVFLHEVVFLIERRSSVVRSTRTFLRRASSRLAAPGSPRMHLARLAKKTRRQLLISSYCTDNHETYTKYVTRSSNMNETLCFFRFRRFEFGRIYGHKTKEASDFKLNVNEFTFSWT